MNKIFLILMFVTGLYAEIIGGISATVKGEAITIKDVKKEMKQSNLDAQPALNILIRKKLEEIEIKDKGIEVSSDDVYDEIKETATRNNMSVSQFYEAVRNSSGLSSTDLKAQIKHRLSSQKLHASIAYSHISPPSEDELKEYFDLHQDKFNAPSAFEVVIYQATSAARLQEKINNPMLNAPDIQTGEQVLPYDRIDPKIASILSKTKIGTFSQIVQNGENGYMSFYLKNTQKSDATSLESVKTQIANEIMDNKREQVLSDYFTRLRQNADIKVLRLPN